MGDRVSMTDLASFLASSGDGKAKGLERNYHGRICKTVEWSLEDQPRTGFRPVSALPCFSLTEDCLRSGMDVLCRNHSVSPEDNAAETTDGECIESWRAVTKISALSLEDGSPYVFITDYRYDSKTKKKSKRIRELLSRERRTEDRSPGHLMVFLSDLWDTHLLNSCYWTEAVTVFFAMYLTDLGLSPDLQVIRDNWPEFQQALVWSAHMHAEDNSGCDAFRFKGLVPVFGNLLDGGHSDLSVDSLVSIPVPHPVASIRAGRFSYEKLSGYSEEETHAVLCRAKKEIAEMKRDLFGADDDRPHVSVRRIYSKIYIPSFDSFENALRMHSSGRGDKRGEAPFGYWLVANAISIYGNRVEPEKIWIGVRFTADLRCKWLTPDPTETGPRDREGRKSKGSPVYLHDLLTMSREATLRSFPPEDNPVLAYWVRWLESHRNPFGKDLARYLMRMAAHSERSYSDSYGLPVPVFKALQHHNWNEYYRACYRQARRFRTNFNRIQPDLSALAVSAASFLDDRSVRILDSLLPRLSARLKEPVTDARSRDSICAMFVAVIEERTREYGSERSLGFDSPFGSRRPKALYSLYARKRKEAAANQPSEIREEDDLATRRAVMERKLERQRAVMEILASCRSVSDYIREAIGRSMRIPLSGKSLSYYTELHDSLLGEIRLDDRAKDIVLVPEKSVFNEAEKALGPGYERLRTQWDFECESNIQHNCVRGYGRDAGKDLCAIFTHMHEGKRYTIEIVMEDGRPVPVQVLSKYNRVEKGPEVAADIEQRLSVLRKVPDAGKPV